MLRATATERGTRRPVWPLLAVALVGLSGCLRGHAPELPAPAAFTAEVQRILAIELLSPEYYDARNRLARMGPEVDAVLVELARSPEAKTVARANALVLLADRGSPAAIPALRRALLTENVEMLRSAAVQGLARLAPRSDTAANLLRSAVSDPARTVRLNALQALDIRDIAVIRALLQVESDPEVRQIALQLVSLAESRGAPIAPDDKGALRTTGWGSDPRLVYRALRVDTAGEYSSGELRVEVPQGRDIPLGDAVEVVAGVIPAFFSPDRSKVVYEVNREIRVLDLVTRELRPLGSGVAPRLVPFTHQFVFLRELPEGRHELQEGTEIRYRVMRASFIDADLDAIGELRAEARAEVHKSYSPVRWMVVGETPDGFVLRGEGISTFLLPTPIFRPAPGERSGRFDRGR